MADTQAPGLITYVDSSGTNWQEFRPGSRRKVLYEDQATGQLTMLIQWGPGYQVEGVVTAWARRCLTRRVIRLLELPHIGLGRGILRYRFMPFLRSYK